MMKRPFFLIAIFLLLISCKDEKKTVKKEENIKSEISIIFPDTVYVNELYNGKINYKNSLDSIDTSLNNVKKYRYIDYYFVKTKNINYTDEYLKKIVTDTFTAEHHRSIPLYAIRFDHLGINYIDGIIVDEVNISLGAKGKNGEPMDRIITNEFRVTKKVIVIKEKEKRKK
ncbi:hypothetical protein [Flavobacterium sp. PL02]|uniref:hypothetical protein n=1 Tax=Flavobacterium sp. PL02 TaxID=3088354 RepID=UPI002B239B9A|nr:hypothetical protein [Flavobacterium sp. PL02]MEA9412712.1 hypothetical protein [Flavobacterium sp. PL02]